MKIRRHERLSLPLQSGATSPNLEGSLLEIIAREINGDDLQPDDSVSLEWFWANRFLPKQTWRGSMQSIVGYVMVSHLLPRLGTVRLCDLQKFDLQAQLGPLAEQYSKCLIQKVRNWIKTVLDEAVDQRYLENYQVRAILKGRKIYTQDP